MDKILNIEIIDIEFEQEQTNSDNRGTIDCYPYPTCIDCIEPPRPKDH